MPRRAVPLTVKQVAGLGRGMYADGHGLYMRVGPGGSRSFVFRYLIDGRRRDMGLGPVGVITLKEARDLALDLRRTVRQGVDPLEAKKAAKAAKAVERARSVTFAQCAASYIESHEAGWRDKRAWPNSMRIHVNPIIGDMQIDTVDTPAVLAVLEPLWRTKTKTAINIRNRLELVLAWATTRQYRTGENPARWRGHLDTLLPKPNRIHTVEHHSALDYREMPAFMTELRSRKAGMITAAIEFVILTCCRASEALEARWDEVDLAGRQWTIPAERMKARTEHRVPLSDAAMAVLHRVAVYKSNSSDYIFLGKLSGRPMTSPALLLSLTRIKPGITVHGFRSSFRNWAAEQTDYPAELAEMALAHTVGSAVERAYRRTDLFDRRRALAEAWAAHCG